MKFFNDPPFFIPAQTIIVDVTKQAIQRHEKDQKRYYSGKKKRHTLKTKIQASLDGASNSWIYNSHTTPSIAIL